MLEVQLQLRCFLLLSGIWEIFIEMGVLNDSGFRASGVPSGTHTRSSRNGVGRGNKCSALGRQGKARLGAWPWASWTRWACESETWEVSDLLCPLLWSNFLLWQWGGILILKPQWVLSYPGSIPNKTTNQPLHTLQNNTSLKYLFSPHGV